MTDSLEAFGIFPSPLANGMRLGLSLADRYDLSIPPDAVVGPVEALFGLLSEDEQRRFTAGRELGPQSRAALEMSVANAVLAVAARLHRREPGLTRDDLSAFLDFFRRLFNDLWS